MFRKAIKTVFSPFYKALAVFTALIVFLIATWLPNLTLLWQIASSSSVSLFEKLTVFSSLALSISTNFTWFTMFVTVLIAFLFGINLAMIVYYMRKQRSLLKQGSAAVGAGGGLLTGFLGIGCAACGTLVLGPFLSFFGGAAFLAFFPFGGQELGLIGLIAISYSIYSISQKIVEPVVCKINSSS